MSRSPKTRWIVRITQWLALVAAVALAVQYAQWILQLDPLARYRNRGERLDLIPGLVWDDVSLRMYDGQTLIGELRADRIEAMRDRSRVRLKGITDGRIHTEQGVVRLEAPHAEYDQRRQVLAVDQGARLRGKDMDIRVEGFTYSRRGHRLATVGTVRGSIGGGTIEAGNFQYFTDKNGFSAGPISWKGNAAGIIKDLPGVQAGRTTWSIRAEDMAVEGDLWVYTKGRATDGDIIVIADRIEHNKKNDLVTATGNIRYFSARANLTCAKVVIYRKEKRAVLTGAVTMLIKPKDQEKLEEAPIPPFRPIVPESVAANRPPAPSEAERQSDEELRSNTVRKYPTQVWAERIVYWYQKGSRRADISGSPQARQELPNGRWRHLWTTKAHFDDQAQTLKLESAEGKKTTRLKTSIGDDLLALWLLVSTDESKPDKMSGAGIEGEVAADDEGEPPATTGGGGNPPPLRGRIGG